MNTEWKRIRNTEHHEPDCSTPEPHIMPMRLGDQLAHCTECRIRWVIPRQPSEQVTQTSTVPQPRSTYACRAHLCPVTWRGKGCRHCQAEREDNAQKRAIAARQRREAARARLDQG